MDLDATCLLFTYGYGSAYELFLPEILHAVGGLPEGAVFQMPYITKIDAIMMSFGQLGTLSVLLITLSSMGTIAAEQKRVYSKSF